MLGGHRPLLGPDKGGVGVSTSPKPIDAEERGRLEKLIEVSDDPAEVKAAMQKLGYDQTSQDNISKRRGLDFKNAKTAPDLTDQAMRDARNAEFARNRAKRGRKSQFLTDTGWEDPVGALTSAGAGPAPDAKPGY